MIKPNFAKFTSLLLENGTVKQTIFKNTFWLAVGATVDRLAKLVFLIYVARILGAVNYGKFTFALAFVSLFVMLHDFGLSTIATREFSKEGREDGEFYAILSLKVLLSVGALFLIFLSSLFVTKDAQIQRAILILAIFSLINSLIAIFYALFQARQKMEYQTWSDTFQVLLIIVFGFFVLLRAPSVENLSYAHLLAAFFALIFTLALFRLKVFRLKLVWSWVVWKKFLTMSWPMALTGLFGAFYSYIDSIIMGHSGKLAETGWYNAAYRVIYVALIPIGLISGSFYPVLSKFFEKSLASLQQAWDYQLKLMILLGLPLMAGGLILAPRIIGFIYPKDFSPAILAFQILIVMAGLAFLYRPYFDIMIVANQQRKTLWITLGSAVVNIVLNLILIPRYSLYGAALAAAITYVFIFMVYFWCAMKFTPIRPFNSNLFRVFLVALASSVLMYFVLKLPSVYRLNVFLSLALGLAVYCLALAPFKKRLNLI